MVKSTKCVVCYILTQHWATKWPFTLSTKQFQSVAYDKLYNKHWRKNYSNMSFKTLLNNWDCFVMQICWLKLLRYELMHQFTKKISTLRGTLCGILQRLHQQQYSEYFFNCTFLDGCNYFILHIDIFSMQRLQCYRVTVILELILGTPRGNLASNPPTSSLWKRGGTWEPTGNLQAHKEKMQNIGDPSSGSQQGTPLAASSL